MIYFRDTYSNPNQSRQNVKCPGGKLLAILKCFQRDVTAFVKRIEMKLDSQSDVRPCPVPFLLDIARCIVHVQSRVEVNSVVWFPLSELWERIMQVVERAMQDPTEIIKIQRQAHQSTEAVTARVVSDHLKETKARPMFIDFLGVGAEPEYPQSGPIASPKFIDFSRLLESPNVHSYPQSGPIARPIAEWEHQRHPDADAAPTRSATVLRDVSSRQSNPHGYYRHGSTHIGSGSTSGGPRFSDHSGHGAGPSDGGNPRSKIQRTEVRGRGKGVFGG
ncbi:hypothetical protein SeMB42_g01099 [Synchytrium endobioticum]|uniref:Uncharacterized protein n=1 Tax=Synchytrium endobioticum TaxID=286115 RepID=A0A507DMY8_9FUNG|nr:hypothetical protein SeMB42_g01099 [Synchytrium endobioticum]